MNGLDGGLELEATVLLRRRRRQQDGLRLIHHRARPERDILPAQGNVRATAIPARPSPGFTVEHEREETFAFGLAREKLRDEPSEPDRLLGKPLAARVGARHVFPSAAIRGINGL